MLGATAYAARLATPGVWASVPSRSLYDARARGVRAGGVARSHGWL